MNPLSIHISRMPAQAGIVRLILVTLMLLMTAGCGYRFAGSAGNRIVAGQSLWVNFIRVEIDSPSVTQTVLRRSILEECHAFRGLKPSADQASADMLIKGNLRSYTRKPVSYSAVDQIKEYRLTVEVDLEFRRKGETVPSWKGTLQGYGDFPVNTDLAMQRSAEEAALATASRVIAQRFMMAVEQSY